MTNNMSLENLNSLDVERVARAQNAVLLAYKRLGNWRAVGEKFGVAHRYAWDLGMNGVVPSNKDVRKKLGLPRVLPSERPIRMKRLNWRSQLNKGLERL